MYDRVSGKRMIIQSPSYMYDHTMLDRVSYALHKTMRHTIKCNTISLCALCPFNIFNVLTQPFSVLKVNDENG